MTTTTTRWSCRCVRWPPVQNRWKRPFSPQTFPRLSSWNQLPFIPMSTLFYRQFLHQQSMWCKYRQHRHSHPHGRPALPWDASLRVSAGIAAGAPARHIVWKRVDANPLPTVGLPPRWRVAIHHHPPLCCQRLGWHLPLPPSSHRHHKVRSRSTPLSKPQLLLVNYLTFCLNRRTCQPSICFAYVLDLHGTVGHRAAVQRGTT